MEVQTFTRNGDSIDAYIIELPQAIPVNRLTSFDRGILDSIADFENYVMPNGMLAPDYYSFFIVDINVYMDVLYSYGDDGYFVTERSAPATDEILVSIDKRFPNAWIGLTLYDASGNTIPEGGTSGSFTVMGLPIVHIAEVPIQNGEISATMPEVVLLSNSPIKAIRVVPNDVVGVDTYKLTIYQNNRG